jgi:hypothetical protein
MHMALSWSYKVRKKEKRRRRRLWKACNGVTVFKEKKVTGSGKACNVK